ncbi:MAG: threonine ammonia-lyase [Chromatiales bacterium]|nr:threonine ammonia-lyase [Chromatiales bacterium]
MTTASPVTLETIKSAQTRIADAIFCTPCARSETLSERLGCNLYLKLENLQMTGSFKDRGAINKMRQLSDAQRAAGVITASAGNHAQGVAHAAKLSGVKATIVMPETTPLAKIRGTKVLGAEIVLHGSGYDDAYEKACQIQDEQGYTFIHAFNDEAIIAGQGTVGLEILDQVPNPDLIVVPVGGGGLISGIATVVKSLKPDTDIIGVEAKRLPAMQRSLAAGEVVAQPSSSTLADGIAIARVGDKTLPIVSRTTSGIVTVSEEEISYAILQLLEMEKTLAEGAGAVGLAALDNHHIENIGGKNVIVVISGGNIDMTLLSKILDRGLERDGRLARLKVVVPDKPGSTATLATIVAQAHSNILEISQNRHASEVQLEETEVSLSLETRGKRHMQQIIAAIEEHGFTVKTASTAY